MYKYNTLKDEAHLNSVSKVWVLMTKQRLIALQAVIPLTPLPLLVLPSAVCHGNGSNHET